MNKLILIFLSQLFSIDQSFCQKMTINNENIAAHNIAVTLAIDHAFLAGDVSKLDLYIAPDAIDYSSSGNIIGLGAIKQFFIKAHAGIGDMKHEIIRTYADNEYVFQWMHVWGTNTDQSGPPVGSKYDVTIVGETRFRGGKAIEYREYIQKRDANQEPGNNAW